MTLKTRLFMSILYLIHQKKPLTLDNILLVGGMPRNLAPTIVHSLEVPSIVNQYTTEIGGKDMRIETLGVDRETVIPITFVPSKSSKEPDLINGYVQVDAARYEKLVLELIADLPSIDICSQWECIKQEGRYDNAIAHEMMHRMTPFHPMIMLNAIEHHYRPDESLYEPLLGKILATAAEWNPNLERLTLTLSRIAKKKHPSMKSAGFTSFSETRPHDMAHWMHSEFIPEIARFFVRPDIQSRKWLIDVCDSSGKTCRRIELDEDAANLEQTAAQIYGP